MVISFTAMVNRITAFEAGLVIGSPVLGAPIMVTALGGVRAWKARPRGSDLVLFALPLLGILYGATIGVYSFGLRVVVIPLLFWLTPILFGLFCFANEDDQHTLGKMFLQALLVCSLIVALYGMWQYPWPPQWDLSWLSQMQELGSARSMGSPAPYAVRIFATLSSPATTALLMVVGILAASQLRSNRKFALLACMVVTLMLTSVRAAWLAVALAGIVLLLRAGAKGWAITGACAVVLAAAAVVFAQTPQGAGFADRFESIGNAKTDVSVNDRQLGMRNAAKLIYAMPFGGGIGYLQVGRGVNFSAVDVGAVSIPVELGYLGTGFYALGLLLSIGTVQLKLLYKDPYVTALSVISLVPLFLLADENLLNSHNGIFFWAPTAFLIYFASSSEKKRRHDRAEAEKHASDLARQAALARGVA